MPVCKLTGDANTNQHRIHKLCTPRSTGRAGRLVCVGPVLDPPTLPGHARHRWTLGLDVRHGNRVSLSLLRGRERGGAFSRTLVAISSALLFSLVCALLLSETQNPPSHGAVSGADTGSDAFKVIIVGAAFGIMAVFPALLAQIWGAKRLAAPTAALLTMSEIVVAIGSAALLLGTELPMISLAGGSIILLSGTLDIYWQYRRTSSRHLKTKP